MVATWPLASQGFKAFSFHSSLSPGDLFAAVFVHETVCTKLLPTSLSRCHMHVAIKLMINWIEYKWGAFTLSISSWVYFILSFCFVHRYLRLISLTLSDLWWANSIVLMYPFGHTIYVLSQKQRERERERERAKWHTQRNQKKERE